MESVCQPRLGSQGRGMFSVVIPTLQRSEQLRQVVDRCAQNSRVYEVIVINNAQTPLTFASEKVRVLDQPSNIFVNPAWNLGVRESEAEWLSIVNDDVLFDSGIFDYVAKVLRTGLFGIVGPDKSCFKQSSGAIGKVGVRLAPRDTTLFGFGTFMCMRKRDYIPIPEEMSIWGGDDWLYLLQRRPNAVLINSRFETEGSTTAKSPEFVAMRDKHMEVCARILDPLDGVRWWHRPLSWLDSGRLLRYHLKNYISARSAASTNGAA